MSGTVTTDVVLRTRIGAYATARRQRGYIGSSQRIIVDVLDRVTGQPVTAFGGASAMVWAPGAFGTDSPGQNLPVDLGPDGSFSAAFVPHIPGTWTFVASVASPSPETISLPYDVADPSGQPASVRNEDWNALQMAGAAAGASAAVPVARETGAAAGAEAGSAAALAISGPYVELAQQGAAQAEGFATAAETAANAATVAEIIATDASDIATTKAGEATAERQRAEDAADAASTDLGAVQQQRAAAEAAAALADTAAAAAAAGANLYPDTATGLAATAEGATFNVAGAGQTYATTYRKTGGAAVLVQSYPSKAALDAIVAVLAPSADVPGIPWVHRDQSGAAVAYFDLLGRALFARLQAGDLVAATLSADQATVAGYSRRLILDVPGTAEVAQDTAGGVSWARDATGREYFGAADIRQLTGQILAMALAQLTTAQVGTLTAGSATLDAATVTALTLAGVQRRQTVDVPGVATVDQDTTGAVRSYRGADGTLGAAALDVSGWRLRPVAIPGVARLLCDAQGAVLGYETEAGTIYRDRIDVRQITARVADFEALTVGGAALRYVYPGTTDARVDARGFASQVWRSDGAVLARPDPVTVPYRDAPDYSRNAVAVLVPGLPVEPSGWWWLGYEAAQSARNLALYGAPSQLVGAPLLDDRWLRLTPTAYLATGIVETPRMTLLWAGRLTDLAAPAVLLSNRAVDPDSNSSGAPVGLSVVLSADRVSVQISTADARAGTAPATVTVERSIPSGSDWRLVGVTIGTDGVRIDDYTAGTSATGDIAAPVMRFKASLPLRLGSDPSGSITGAADHMAAVLLPTALTEAQRAVLVAAMRRQILDLKGIPV